MFIQSCFIRKNTLELRKKLEELGYRYCSSFDKEAPYLWLGEGVIYDTFNVGITILKVGEYLAPYGISCGDNEELFLALAALRDDTDKNQWFISNVDIFTECYNNEWKLYENWCSIFTIEDLNSEISPIRKATIKEIIEHFKEK